MPNTEMEPDEPRTQGQRAEDDIKRHGGALAGMVAGGVVGSIVPGIGTLIGMIGGAVIGHVVKDRKRD